MGLTAEAIFLESAARPGIQTPKDPYTTAQDFASAARTITEAIGRKKPGRAVKQPPDCLLSADVTWRSESLAGPEGALHRWTTVERMSSAALARELHSWHVAGEVSVYDAPMVLHAVELGTVRNGHLHSHWCRIFRHPSVLGRLAFQKKDGSRLEGDWKALWFAQNRKNDPKEWVDLMERDEVQLIHEINVRPPSKAQREATVRDIVAEARRMRQLPGDWRDMPMYRPACDAQGECVYQMECYQP